MKLVHGNREHFQFIDKNEAALKGLNIYLCSKIYLQFKLMNGIELKCKLYRDRVKKEKKK